MSLMRASDVRERLTEVKRLLVAAHRSGDGESARVLSQRKEVYKRRLRRKCADCPVAIGRDSTRCMMHHVAHRRRKRLSL